MESVVIIGAGQQGRNCKRLALLNGHKVACFVDENEELEVEGVRVYRSISYVPNKSQHKYIVAIGDMEARKKFVEELDVKGLRGITLVDPTADIEEGAEIGEGNYISKFVTIYSSAKVGRHNIINCKAVLATDAVVGDNCNLHMGCNICGASVVGDNSIVGYQATIKSGFGIGRNCEVEPYAYVDYDLPSGKKARRQGFRREHEEA